MAKRNYTYSKEEEEALPKNEYRCSHIERLAGEWFRCRATEEEYRSITRTSCTPEMINKCAQIVSGMILSSIYNRVPRLGSDPGDIGSNPAKIFEETRRD